MEYTEGMYKMYEPVADQRKINFVKEFSEKWVNVDCKKSDNPEICEKKTKAMLDYNVDLLKLKFKIDKCAQLIKNAEYDYDSSNGANACANSLESATKSFVDKYYQRLKDLNQL